MRGLSPKDIPTSGYYDFTVIKRSLTSTFVQAIIDTGQYKGKRVSGDGGGYKVGDRFRAYLEVVTQARIEGKLVDVPVTFKEADVFVTYNLTDHHQPENDPEFRLRTKSRFRR
jgi:hypothetical protein